MASFRRMTDISATQLHKLEQSHFPGWSLPTRCVVKDFEKRGSLLVFKAAESCIARDTDPKVDSDLNTIIKGFC